MYTPPAEEEQALAIHEKPPAAESRVIPHLADFKAD
jgi:hypothetical protein